MAIIKLRRATASEWSTSNPTLREGEVGIQLAADPDDVILKIGNGVTAWNSLPEFGAGGGGSAVLDATGSVKGILKLAGDLGGTADAPTVPGKAPLVHTHDLADIDDLDVELPELVQPIVDGSLLGGTLGMTAGVPIQPWAPEARISGELWTTANMSSLGGSYQTSSLTPFLVPNGTTQTLITRVKFADTTAGNEAFRIEFDYTAPNTGWGSISLRLNDGSGATIKNEQRLVTLATNGPQAGHFLWDFHPGTNGGSMFFDLVLALANNANAGSNLAISNVSIRAIGSDVQRPLQISKEYADAPWPYAYFQQRDVKTKVWKAASLSFAQESDLTPVSFQDIAGFYDDQPFASKPPDPTFTRTIANMYDSVNEAYTPSAPNVSLRVNNNDQIHVVWNGSTWDYRGNTHGGEFTRSTPGVSYKVDYGSGWTPWTLTRGLQGCRRFQVKIPSEYRRSVDGTTPYCTVDRDITVFQDGMIRTDRTTTFTAATTTLQAVFEWMSSHSLDVPYLGRAGRGLTVIGETDSFPKVAVPAVPTSSTATTGGTLVPATYSYRVTALSSYGETTVSPAKTQVVPAGTSTNTVTISWSAVTNAIGYRVYGRVNGGPEGLLASVTALTWIDTGAIAPAGSPPKVNGAWIFNNTTVDTMAQSASLTWTVYKEPRTGWCYANLFDRDAALSRSGVTAVISRLMRGSGIQKSYANLVFGGNPSLVVPSGTVWSATHWNYVYLPADPDQYHNEVAVRAAYLSALSDIYPST